ncbi:PREDICTED: uncharacterized protein LOC105957515 [Erythranthe guttata]|uniref:uncharacterized protein LOC105957515 n=1 Tax=Erythranthe guttata TaxID=4155 RepID=UPI00064DB1DE|nr:PREDICTED: uncharacterized protein LOC105957515 [Erythranthe guttata]|eukprot:XP_012836895.1 PREDICTED: uncharacterized protein LOC105957515 [Erythranthe guttata]
MDAAASYAVEVETLNDPEVYDECLFVCYISLAFQFSNNFDDIQTNRRMDWLRNRYFRFKEYIAKPGVTFNVNTRKVTVDRSFWPVTLKETVEERTFRINGFPLFEDCHFVFDVKHAPAVDFRGVEGYDPDYPVVIHNDDDDEQVDVAVEANPPPNAPIVVDPHYAIYLDDLYNHLRIERGNNGANNNNGNEAGGNEAAEPAVSFSDNMETSDNSESL